MFWDMGHLLIPNQILKMKLKLLKHISQLENKSLAKKVYNQQKKYKLPGLVEEANEEMMKLGLTIKTMEESSTKEWSKEISNLIERKNKEEILRKLKSYKKIEYDEVSKEDFGIKNYMKNLTYEDSLFAFRIRGKVVKSIRTHFKKEDEYADELWSCWEPECTSLDTMNHIKDQCIHYDSLKTDLDLQRDEDVVKFFRRVLEKREQDIEDKTSQEK